MLKVRKNLFITVLTMVSLLIAIFAFMLVNDPDKKTVISSDKNTNVQVVDAEEKPSLVAAKSTKQLLEYLIEEEKLAHDVYTVMYEKYGAKVFGNILESETTHQGRVLTLLQARSIDDPRSSEAGVYKDAELQALYDALIEQGNLSAQEAYKVGVIIEEKDIKDISTQLSTATEQDVIATLELLRTGSENHLRAFNRQLL